MSAIASILERLISIVFDSEIRGYVAEVAELPGCVSQGKTLDEAVENIKDTIKGYLYVLEKHGKPDRWCNRETKKKK
ncbi:type II toxin-antitoxin system HicB family antitoxin [Rivularia sp. UHCC 0363]|uniref:type II toxin-antitoxin system HicB family antitoxin n=1 Tax=Rivularia sp. UHCC 0363 TaxID=3110244 RepID=UPI002B200338|nr:type II toxin-antitoxin system HicB family antitoxin [Rivularia sp. UHCC 0363]MEA5593031.1 type II toxin-antitoxin system HicB family antitoxin [Rivularia sp. UHCC 0363]